MQQLIGLFTHPFMHRRNLRCVFEDVFNWIESFERGEAKRIPGTIVDEIIAAVLLLPLADSNIRWQISDVISATDATPVGGELQEQSRPQILPRISIGIACTKASIRGSTGLLGLA